MSDILLTSGDWIFSYRVAGILVENGRVLLQRPTSAMEYAFPGGHVTFGETNAETLKREFLEEIGAEIEVGSLKWVWEIFFAWGSKPCHQICNYYLIKLAQNSRIPLDGAFPATDELGGKRADLVMEWVDIARLSELLVYPEPSLIPKIMARVDDGRIEHFVYNE